MSRIWNRAISADSARGVFPGSGRTLWSDGAAGRCVSEDQLRALRQGDSVKLQSPPPRPAPPRGRTSPAFPAPVSSALDSKSSMGSYKSSFRICQASVSMCNPLEVKGRLEGFQKQL